MSTRNTLYSTAALLVLSLAFLPFQTVSAAWTNATFIGGCPDPINPQTNTTTCNSSSAGNEEATLAALLGVDPSLVDEVAKVEGDPFPDPGSDGGLSTTGSGTSGGTWNVGDSGITFLAMKVDGWTAYFQIAFGETDFVCLSE